MDPACHFVKSESHPEVKQETRHWRLIWNVSDPDRLIDFLVLHDQDHGEVVAFWCIPGVGH